MDERQTVIQTIISAITVMIGYVFMTSGISYPSNYILMVTYRTYQRRGYIYIYIRDI